MQHMFQEEARKFTECHFGDDLKPGPGTVNFKINYGRQFWGAGKVFAETHIAKSFHWRKVYVERKGLH